MLHEPEIPGNTGSIGRLCVGLEANLIMIEPLGFSLEDKYMRRAGLDYWQHLSWAVFPSLDALLDVVPDRERLFFLTTKSSKPYAHARFQRGDFLVFGKETKGLPQSLLDAHWDHAFTIPMFGKVRSLNLAVATGIVAYEAIRQIEGGFE